MNELAELDALEGNQSAATTTVNSTVSQTTVFNLPAVPSQAIKVSHLYELKGFEISAFMRYYFNLLMFRKHHRMLSLKKRGRCENWKQVCWRRPRSCMLIAVHGVL